MVDFVIKHQEFGFERFNYDVTQIARRMFRESLDLFFRVYLKKKRFLAIVVIFALVPLTSIPVNFTNTSAYYAFSIPSQLGTYVEVAAVILAGDFISEDLKSNHKYFILSLPMRRSSLFASKLTAVWISVIMAGLVVPLLTSLGVGFYKLGVWPPPGFWWAILEMGFIALAFTGVTSALSIVGDWKLSLLANVLVWFLAYNIITQTIDTYFPHYLYLSLLGLSLLSGFLVLKHPPSLIQQGGLTLYQIQPLTAVGVILMYLAVGYALSYYGYVKYSRF